MAIQDFVNQEIVTQKWAQLLAVFAEYDKIVGQMRAAISALEADDLYISDASDDEKSIVAAYKARVE